MPTLTIRRLDEADHEWLRQSAEREGISVEECMRRLVRTARAAASRTLGDVVVAMNASLDADERALLAEPPVIERPSVSARDPFAPGEDEVQTREAS